jgi:hypothetical protein
MNLFTWTLFFYPAICLLFLSKLSLFRGSPGTVGSARRHDPGSAEGITSPNVTQMMLQTLKNKVRREAAIH